MTWFMELDSEVMVRLKEENAVYADLCDRAAGLIENRPALYSLLMEDAVVSLSGEDAATFIAYRKIMFRMENLERRALYLQGRNDRAAD